MKRKLRPYQADAIEAIHAALHRSGSTVAVLATGLGKTIIASSLISNWEHGNTLFLAHTRELITQAADKLSGDLGYRPPVEMGTQWVDVDTIFDGGMCVVASVQTMYGDKRLEKYRNNPFSLIVVDECFPAGTLVDGKPIETIRPGDMVTSFDDTGATVKRAVTHVFENPAPTILLKIHAGGRCVTTTQNHPFFTARGWVNAGDIKVGDDVYGLFPDVRSSGRAAADEVSARGDSAILLPSVPHEMAVPGADSDLCHLQSLVRCGDDGASAEGCETSDVLLASVREGRACGGGGGQHGEHQPQTRIGTHEEKEPDAPGGDSREGIRDYESDRLRADGSRRERAWDDAPGTDALGCGGTLPVHRSGGADRRVSDPLQGRLGESDGSTGNRDRRGQSPLPQGESSGRAQNGLLGITRVDCVEVHERACNERYGSLCPGNRVYNLEVEGEHTYLADGFAVHNCHHAAASTYRKVLDFFRAINPSVKVVGITATPNRSDKTALGIVFESEAFQMSILDAIGQGWLVPIQQEYVVCEAINYDGLNTRRNEFGEADFNGAALEDVMKEESTLHAIAKPLVEKAGDRPTLVFCAGVEHAHAMAAVLNRYKPGSAKAVDGKTDTLERNGIVQQFADGKLQFLTNCMVFTEGFDAPNCSCVAMARPTKSSSMYTQMLGRGLRPLPGVVDGPTDAFERHTAIFTSDKPACVVLDFVGNSKHKLANVYDVLGGNYDIETRDLAREEATRQRKPVSEVLEQAKALLDLQRQWSERKHITASGVYHAYEVNPFEGDGPAIQKGGFDRGGCSDSQVQLLVNLGVPYQTAASKSKREAGAMIDKIGATRCTAKQAATLKRAGINTAGIGFERAGRIITALKANNWQPLQEVPA